MCHLFETQCILQWSGVFKKLMGRFFIKIYGQTRCLESDSRKLKFISTYYYPNTGNLRPDVGRNSQRCRKSELSEIGNGSKVGTRKSEIKIFFRKSEIGRKKTPEIGNRKAEIGNKIFIFITEIIFKIVRWQIMMLS